MGDYSEVISVPPTLQPLLQDVATARGRYVELALRLTDEQAQRKPAPDVWSAVDITEHLVWAEQGGIWGMWRAVEAQRSGRPVWAGEHTNRGRSIEAIVAETWQPKEQVPAIAAPRMGGSLAFWCASLLNLQHLLLAFSRMVREDELKTVIHPHPISGPLDIRQRFEFLRFHIDRHRRQLGGCFPNPDAIL
ncbi:DinB family protein [Spirosoma arcticum]